MITLQYCANLFKHHDFLTDHIGHENHFIVGGALRDILLGLSTDPTDIDVTLATTPEQLLKTLTIDQEKTSMFSTEKFGTTTLIPKVGQTVGTEYEITPFREETGYSDNRHPDSIQRSHDLLLDSKRRDFTINCLYRTTTTISCTLAGPIAKDSSIPKVLHHQGAIYDQTTKTLLIQNHDLINTCFPAGVIDLDVVTDVLKKTHIIGTHTDLKSQRISIILDPHNGINDMVDGIITTVGNPLDRFEEDALRIVRGARLAITLNTKLPPSAQQNAGFDFRKKTRQAMIQKSEQVKTLSFERLNQEIIKVFTSSNPFGFISLLHDLGLTQHIFPSLAGTIHNTQPARHHPFDTYTHTILTLYHLQQRNNDYRVKLAMLYHDVGKPQQYAFMEKAIAENPENPDRTGYEAHADISVRMMQKDFKRLCFPKKDINIIAWYIQYHHRPGEILEAKEENRIKKLRRLLSDGGLEACLNLMDIVIADRLGQYNPLQPPALAGVLELKQQLERLHQQEGRFTQADLCIGGKDILETFNLTPGPIIGDLLTKTFERVLTDVPLRNNKKDTLDYIKGLLG